MPTPSTRPAPIFYPKLISTLKSYSWSLFMNDATSGVIVGIVALPLAIAFAIASGVAPQQGLITAVVGGFLISLLGGSKVQIGGPTGAFVVIVYGIVHQYGSRGLMISTILAGIFLVGMGLLRLGSIIKFIPYPLIVGFTSGIAVIIFSSQIRDALGLDIQNLPADFLEKWKVFGESIGTLNTTALLLFLLSLGIIHGWQRMFRKIPGSIVAIVAVTAAVRIFHLNVDTIGSRFGDLPSTLPAPHWAAFDFNDIKFLIAPAFTIALLGGIESLLSATVADGMIESRHRPNTELIAQGVANILTPLFGGIPATGAIARTATNVKNGGRTPVAGIIHSLTLLLILFLFGQWIQLVPLCVLAAILTIVSYHMSEWHAFRALLRAPRSDVAILLMTFFLTVFVDLTVAVEVGLVLSAVFFMKHMKEATAIREITDRRESDAEEVLPPLPPGVKIYEAEGALFFGVAEMLRDNLDIGSSAPRVIIFRMRHVLTLDATAIRALSDLVRSCRKRGIHILIEGIRSRSRKALERTGLAHEIGGDNFHPTLEAALQRAQSL